MLSISMGVCSVRGLSLTSNLHKGQCSHDACNKWMHKNYSSNLKGDCF